MELSNREIARRIKGLRADLGVSAEEMARVTGLSVTEYMEAENGGEDFTASFILHCAQRLGVDMIEIMTGENPHLSDYTLVRAGAGLPIKRREGFTYSHLAGNLKDKLAEPFLVTAPYDAAAETAPIALSRHDGQEFDYVLEGQLRIVIDGHEETLSTGDSVYYDSGKAHGMIATGGQGCRFLAVLMTK